MINKTLVPLISSFDTKTLKLWFQYCTTNLAGKEAELDLVSFIYYSKDQNLNTTLDRYTKVSYGQRSKLVFNLFLMTEDFIILQHYSAHAKEKLVLLNEIYNTNSLFNLANKTKDNFDKLLDHNEANDLKDLTLSNQILQQQYYSNNPIKYTSEVDLFSQMVNAFSMQSTIVSLMYHAEAINWGKIKQVDYTFEIIALKGIANEKIITTNTNAFNSIIKVLKDKNVTALMEVYEMIKSGQILRKSFFHSLLTLYCLRLVVHLWTEGLINDKDKIAEILEYGVKSKVYFVKEKIPTTRFFNIINTLGNFKTYEWNKAFIDNWINQVENGTQFNVKATAYAINAFVSERYEDIGIFLRGCSFTSPRFNIRVMRLRLISLFEDRKSNYTTLKAELSNQKSYLKRHKHELNNHIYRVNTNFIKVIELLILRDFKVLKKINLNDYNPVIYRSYLQNKIDKT